MPNPFNMNNNLGNFSNINMAQIRQMYQMFKSGGDPIKMVQAMSSQNPQAQQVLQMLKSGNNPEQMFRTLCQQKGINPDEFIRSITG